MPKGFLSHIPTLSEKPLSDAEWQRLLAEGVSRKLWADLWRLARIAPLTRSARLCRALGASGWAPSTGQDAFKRLTALAAGLPEPEAVPFVRKLPRGVPANITTEIQVSPDGTLLAVNGNGPILLFRVPDGELVRTIQEPTRRGGKFIHNCAFSPDGRTLATQCSDEFPRLWDLTDPEQPPRVLREASFDASYQAILFTPDGAQLVVLHSGRGGVSLWNVESGTLKSLKGHTMWVKCACITADSKRLYTGSADRTVRVWALPEGELLHTWEQGDSVQCMALSPDETRLAVGENRGTCAVRVWDTATGEEKLCGSHPNAITGVAFSPDGTLLASGGGHHVAGWRVADGELLYGLRGHENFVECVAFSRDGHFIFSGGYDNILHIWRAADGAAVQDWRDSRSYTDPIVPLPDGRWVASCGWKEEHVWLWRMLPHPDAVTPLEHLGDAYWEWVAASVARDDLSADERAWLEFAHALDAIRLPMTALHANLDALTGKLTLPPGESLLPHLNEDAVFAALDAADWEILAQQAEKLGKALPERERAATVAGLQSLAEQSYAVENQSVAEALRQLARTILRVWAAQKKAYGSAARDVLGQFFVTYGEPLTGPFADDLFNTPDGDLDKILFRFFKRDWSLLEIHQDPLLVTQALEHALGQGDDQAARVKRLAVEADRAVVSVAMTRATGDTTSYVPREPAQRALHYFLLSQWADYETLDVDGRLVGAAYTAAVHNFKRIIAMHARANGRVEFVRAVAHLPREDRSLEDDEFWNVLADALAQGQHWQPLWALTYKVPLRAGILLLQRLRGSGWQPPHSDPARFAALLEAAAPCAGEPPAATLPQEYHAMSDSMVGISQDGQWLAFGSSSNIKLRHLTTAEERTLYDFDSHERLRAIALSPDGQYAAGLSDKRFCLWRVADAQRVLGQSGYYGRARITFTPDGRYVLMQPPGYTYGTVSLWSVPEGERVELAPSDLRIGYAQMRPQGDWVAAAPNLHRGMIYRWRLPGGEPLPPLGVEEEGETIHALAFSPDGAWLVSGHKSHALRVWEADTGRLLTTLHKHEYTPSHLAFSPDGQTLASADHFTMHIWRVPAFEKVATPVALSSQLSYKPPVGLIFSPNSRIVALIRKDNRYINLYHAARGTYLGRIDAGEARYRVTDVAFTPDSATLACATGSSYVQLWPLTSTLLLDTRPDELNTADIAWLECLMARAPEPWGEAMLALLRWQRQYDIELEASRALLGDLFDIELE